MAGEHYFSPAPDSQFRPRTISVQLAGRSVEVTTSNGIFSPEHIDTGSEVLLASVPAPPPSGDLLDLGCGWGPIALSLALAAPAATVWAVDVNSRALELTRRNAEDLGLTNVNAVLPDDVPAAVAFGAIWSNPPIRVGKAELHTLLLRWLPRLRPGSAAWLVVQRNLGSDSLQRWLDSELPPDLRTERAATKHGFRVLRVERLGEGTR